MLAIIGDTGNPLAYQKLVCIWCCYMWNMKNFSKYQEPPSTQW